MTGWTRRAALAAAVVLASCTTTGEAETASAEDPRLCRIAASGVQLPAAVHETSGAAFHPGGAGVFWTHNDSGGDPVLYAIGADGHLAGRVTVDGARNDDWEDIAAGPCPAGTCLYVADIGDNGRKKKDPVALYRVPLPAPADGTVLAETFQANFPGGSRDAEAFFVLPDGSAYVISKGNDEPIALYRWPTPLERGPVDLVEVRELAPRPEQPGDRVTGADATPDGRWVAVRSYGSLYLYRTADLLGTGTPAFTVDLAALGEEQGEGVAIADNGQVLLTSESREKVMPGRATLLQCELPAN